MAPLQSASGTSSCTDTNLKTNSTSHTLSYDSEIHCENLEDSPEDEIASPVMLKQIENMLQKALKRTSDHITTNLTKKIRELGQRLSTLETRVDDIENNTVNTVNCYTEIDNLGEENILQTRLEDYENHA